MQKNFYENSLENKYSENTSLEHRRSLGQFFTPYKIARFMAEWILQNPKKTLKILDPATGFGIFERALANLNKNKKLSFELWEIDKNISTELKKLTEQLNLESKIFNGDFFKKGWDNKFDGIIANPPYFKHHFINEKEKIYQEICLRTYFRFSLQTNIYCWFLIKAINLLADGGRLAFIVPSEFLNANYGEKVKEYLKQTGIVLHLISINFNENVFDNALTTSVIILAEKTKSKFGQMNLYSVHSPNELESLSGFLKKHPNKIYNLADLDPATKWRNYFNGNGDKKLSSTLVPVSLFGRFSRGIATGSNNYFTLSLSESTQHKLPQNCLLPCITKASYAKNVYFGNDEFEELKKNDRKVFLFNGQNVKNPSCLEYISKGEEQGVNLKYLTSNRDPWYALEKRAIAPIWVAVFGRNGLKFIWNDSECINLTCFHAFYPANIGQDYLDIFFLYLHSKTAEELFDREKREYGNGLEKFEPNDLNKALMVDLRLLSSKDKLMLSELKKVFLKSDTQKRQGVLKEADNVFSKFSLLAS